MYPALFRHVDLDYRRQRFETPDQDFFDTDLLDGVNGKAMVLIHGLEGSANSAYMRGMAKHFHRQGFSIYALNFRSCSGEPNRLLTSYHSGFTNDLRQVLNHLVADSQTREIYFCGFSLGGNALLRFLAAQGSGIHPKVKAGAAISVPVDLKASAQQLARFSNSIYMERFLGSLKNKIRIKSQMFPGQIDLKGLNRIHNFKDFDDRFTAPIHGFRDADDYWKQCSSLYVLDEIRVPTLLLNAKNDPFLPLSCYPLPYTDDKQTFVKAIYPKHGGHVGFVAKDVYWSERMVGRFFEEVRA
jgi:predicted alpha/beta-fold hydrolase